MLFYVSNATQITAITNDTNHLMRPVVKCCRCALLLSQVFAVSITSYLMPGVRQAKFLGLLHPVVGVLSLVLNSKSTFILMKVKNEESGPLSMIN